MVYVDNQKNKYRCMVMCHMIADTEKELHEMAGKIGIKRKWFQGKGIKHYDICLTKRTLAIQNGAKEITPHELVSIIKKTKQNERKSDNT